MKVRDNLQDYLNNLQDYLNHVTLLRWWLDLNWDYVNAELVGEKGKS